MKADGYKVTVHCEVSDDFIDRGWGPMTMFFLSKPSFADIRKAMLKRNGIVRYKRNYKLEYGTYDPSWLLWEDDPEQRL